MTTTTAQVRSLLLPGLDEVFGDYDRYPAEWKAIFTKHTSNKASEQDIEMKMFGLAQMRTEGASVEYDDMGERAITNYTHVESALGFVITKNAVRDNLYKAQFKPGVAQLKVSLLQTKEIIAANVLNFAMDTSGLHNLGDGRPLLAIDHPLDYGVNPNTFAIQSELNETSLQDAITRIGKFRDAAGLLIRAQPKRLVIGSDLQFVAERLLNTPLRVDTANNDINAIRSMGFLADGYLINHYLTNPKAWYIITDVANGFKYYEREAVETDMQVDFDTDNLKTKAFERYSFGVSNSRAVFGSMP